MEQVVGLAVLVNLITWWFDPIQSIKYKVLDKLPEWIGKPFTCSKCGGLWFGLLYFQDIFLATLTSFTAYIIEWILDYINEWKNG